MHAFFVVSTDDPPPHVSIERHGTTRDDARLTNQIPPLKTTKTTAELAVDAVLRLKGSSNLDHIQITKKPGAYQT